MLVTQQNILRRFWYPVLRTDDLADGPKPFTLLGEDIVIWSGPDGAPAVAVDRCCHRSAKLSRGWVEDGNIVCGYHGWTYDSAGTCVDVPQQKKSARGTGFAIQTYKAATRYGYVWVCLDAEPLGDIPEIEEAEERRRAAEAAAAKGSKAPAKDAGKGGKGGSGNEFIKHARNLTSLWTSCHDANLCVPGD